MNDDLAFFEPSSINFLKCSFCRRFFSDPIVTECGHTFCRSCLTEEPTFCPFDQEIVKIVAQNHLVQQQIEHLLINCKFASNQENIVDPSACPVKIHLKNRREHEEQCLYRFVSCPRRCTSDKIRYKDLSQHLLTCSNRSENHFVSAENVLIVEQELQNKISQINGLVESCSQLSQTVNSMRREIDSLKNNQEVLSSRNDLLLSEFIKRKLTSPIPTTIDEENDSIRNSQIFLDEQCASCFLRLNGTFAGHSETVWCLHALDDLLISGSADKTVKIWNLSETPFSNSATLHGHQDAVLSLTVKDRTVLTGGADKSIFAWNLDSFDRISSFDAHTDPVCALTWHENLLYSSSHRCLKVWDIERLTLVNEIQTDDRSRWLRVLMVRDKCIYAGCRRTIKVFDTVNHRISFEFELPRDDSIYSLTYSDSLLFAGGASGMIYIWDIRENRCLETNVQHENTVYGLCVVSVDSMKSSNLISASSDRTIRVWSTETFEQIQCEDRHDAEVTAVHRNAQYIMSGATDSTIKVWDWIKVNDDEE